MAGPPAAPPVVVDVSYDHLKGFGQTVLKQHGYVNRKALVSATVKASRTEIQARLPIEVNEPIVINRVRRGSRLPDGSRYVFVNWYLGHRTARFHRAAERLSRAYLRLTTKRRA